MNLWLCQGYDDEQRTARAARHHRTAPAPFSLHRIHTTIVYQAASHTASPPPFLQPHVFRLFLVRRVQQCGLLASASEAERRLRQLRRDGEKRPCCSSSSLCRLRCGLRCINLCVTRCYAGCRVLRERCGGQDHALSVAAPGRGGSGALVAAVRMVQRADDVRQLLRGCGVGGMDDAAREWLQRSRQCNPR
jgi:hypothetical protein